MNIFIVMFDGLTDFPALSVSVPTSNVHCATLTYIFLFKITLPEEVGAV